MPPDNTSITAPITAPPSPSRGGGSKLRLLIEVLLVLAMLAFAVLAIYYISQYNTAQTTVDQQKAEAAEAAKAEQKAADEKDFAESLKQPYRAYTAPAVIGALTVNFPKTWNVFSEEDQEAAKLNVFMNPELVRSEKGYDGPFALRVKLEKGVYADALKGKQKEIEKGTLKAETVTVSGIAGTRLTGKVEEEHTGVMVMIPLRDKTLTIWTESNDFVNDFNTVIERLSVVP